MPILADAKDSVVDIGLVSSWLGIIAFVLTAGGYARKQIANIKQQILKAKEGATRMGIMARMVVESGTNQERRSDLMLDVMIRFIALTAREEEHRRMRREIFFSYVILIGALGVVHFLSPLPTWFILVAAGLLAMTLVAAVQLLISMWKLDRYDEAWQNELKAALEKKVLRHLAEG